MVTPVQVNPSSALGVESNTGSSASNASQTFYFGGNPNIAAAVSNKWIWIGAAAVVLGFLLLRRGRP